MRWRLLVCLLFPISASADPPDRAPTDWTLTFSDDFHSVDRSRWQTYFPNGERHLGHGEKQMYVDPTYTGGTSMPLGLNPFSVDDDGLIIRADRPSPMVRAHLQGQVYTSGLLTTNRSFRQTYGYFEIRAQFPYGRGLWPTFWLIAVNRQSPEIDVVEVYGDKPNNLYTTVHWSRDGKEQQTSFTTNVPDMTQAFHTYGTLWSATDVAWYFDGKLVAHTRTPPDMHQPMYLLINLAVGNESMGQPDANTKFPADMRVSYVRAYALPQ